MYRGGSVLTIGVAAGLLLYPASGDRANAQSGSSELTRSPAQQKHPQGPVARELPEAERKARQELSRAEQLAMSGGHDAEAILAIHEALKAHVKPAIGTPDDFAIHARSHLADLYKRTGDVVAEVGVRRELLNALSNSLDKGDWRTREASYLLADAERRLASTPEHRRRLIEATEHFNRANALMIAGHHDEALRFAVKATEIYRELEGKDHRDVSNALVLRGIICREKRDYMTARSMFEEAIVVRRKVLGENHPDSILVLQHLGRLADVQGDVPGATRLFERAVELEQQNTPDDTAARAELLETIGRLLQLQGDHEGSRPYLGCRASAIREKLAFVNAKEVFSFGRLLGGWSGARLGHGARALTLTAGSDISAHGARSPAVKGPRESDQRAPWSGESVIGSRRRDDNLAMTQNPSHPWTLRLRSMQMYVHAAGGKEPAKVEALGSAFEQGIIRGDVWIAYARNLSRLADVAEAQGEADKARLLRLRSIAVGLEATGPLGVNSWGACFEFLDTFVILILGMAEPGLAQDLALQSMIERKLAWGDRHPAYAPLRIGPGWERCSGRVATGHLKPCCFTRKAAREDVPQRCSGEGHFELAGSSYRLALLHMEGDDRDEARRHAGKSLELSETFVMASLPFLPERQRLALLAQSTRAALPCSSTSRATVPQT